MHLENGQDGKEKRYAEELRHKVDSGESADDVPVTDVAAASPGGAGSEAGGQTPATQDVGRAIAEETKPVSPAAQSPEFNRSYPAEASVAKKIIVFALATILVLIALGLIYAYWPAGAPRT